MSFIQAIFIAILQGATELFPVSSLGHAVLVPALLGWIISSHDPTFLPFLVMLHFGTAFALLLFFWRDWYALIRGILGIDGSKRRQESFYIVMLLVIATLPAVIIGGLAEKYIRPLFSTPDIVAILLICNGFVLIYAEKIKKKRAIRANISIAQLRFRDALWIGILQCTAFFPGISRSGSTIVGGLLCNLSHENAGRFSFLMALPVILAASVHQAWQVHSHHIPWTHLHIILTATVLACITALLSTAFLMHYFKNHDNWAMTPFGIYCILLGGSSLLAFYFFI